MRKQTYGRRTNATSALTAQCFFGSSPAALAHTPSGNGTGRDTPDKSVAWSSHGDCAAGFAVPSDSPASNTRSKAQKRRPTSSNPCESLTTDIPGPEEVETLVSGLNGLVLNDDASAVLQPRNVNVLEQPRRPQQRKKTVPKKKNTTHGNDMSLEQSLNLLKLNDQPQRTASRSTSEEGKQRRAPARKPATSPDTPRIVYAAYTAPLLKLCGDRKGRQAPTPFQDWVDDIARYFTVVKIAEASYGEVYRLSLKETVTTAANSRDCLRRPPRQQQQRERIGQTDESVLKIIALKAPPPSCSAKCSPGESKEATAIEDVEVVDETAANKSAVDDVASEVRVLRHLSPIPGFTNFREVRVLQGRVPRLFVSAWRRYNKEVKKSYFPDPGLKDSYAETQLWAVVEMQDAGVDVETLVENAKAEVAHPASPEKSNANKMERRAQREEGKADVWRGISVFTAWDLFWGVALAVAKGEEYAGFEHRDLHMGNICIRPKSATAISASSSDILHPASTELNISRTVGYSGLETTLIDYTLSRANVGPVASKSQPSSPLSLKGNSRIEEDSTDVAFFDLSKDAQIFRGDANVDYQYEIYRFMRNAVVHGDPVALEQRQAKGLAKKSRSWKKGRDKGAQEENNGSQKLWRGRHPMTNLVWLHFVLFKLLQDISADESAEEPQDTTAGREIRKLERELRLRLHALRDALGLEQMAGSEVGCAAELVQWALELGWLAEEDVTGLQ